MRAVDRTAPWGNSAKDLRVGESQLPSADRKEALAQAQWCLATKTSIRVPLFCLSRLFHYRMLLFCPFPSFQSKLREQFSSRATTSHSLCVSVFALSGTRCDRPLATAYDDCVRPARRLCPSSGSEWVGVETTPQRPKILKPPPNHPPQNKPPNRIHASCLSLAPISNRALNPSSCFEPALFHEPALRSSATHARRQPGAHD